MKLSLEEIHERCKKIYCESLFTDIEGVTDYKNGILGPSVVCKIYDVLTDGDETLQDCIGENFNYLIQELKSNWFDNYKPTNSVYFYFTNYILLLYLIVERIDIIKKLYENSLVNGNLNKSSLNLSSMKTIRNWANFIKHPKEFLFTHWPFYYLEDNKEDYEFDINVVIINKEFIKAHYSGPQNERPIILENNKHVSVEVPNLEKLTLGFCNDLKEFIEFICQHKNLIDLLKVKSIQVNLD
jgi:hypothetical protein